MQSREICFRVSIKPTFVRVVQNHDPPMSLAYLGLGADWAAWINKENLNTTGEMTMKVILSNYLMPRMRLASLLDIFCSKPPL